MCRCDHIDNPSDNIEDCRPDPVVDEIAWTCATSDRDLSSRAWPVRLKKKNPWGLYDMLGNVEEMVSDPWRNIPYGRGEAHVVDPHGFVDESNSIPIRGCCWINAPACCRSGYTTENSKDLLNKYQGFRPVRTVFE